MTLPVEMRLRRAGRCSLEAVLGVAPAQWLSSGSGPRHNASPRPLCVLPSRMRP